MKQLMTLGVVGVSFFFIASSHAELYHSTQNPDGTFSTHRVPENAPQPKHHHHKSKTHLNVSIGIPASQTTTYYPSYVAPQNNTPIYWVNRVANQTLPNYIVQSGYQHSPHLDFYVCRANYNGGVHPGKLVRGKCDISWGGRELLVSPYQVLVSHVPLNWFAASYGFIPGNAIHGGYENGHPLFICQAQYRNGWHSGKVVGDACLFGASGREVAVPYYNVLVR